MNYVATFEKVATLDSARVIHWTLAGTDGSEVSGQYLSDFFKNLGDKVVYVQDLSRDGPFLADYALKNHMNDAKDYIVDCSRQYFCIKVGTALILNLKKLFNFSVSDLSEKLGLPKDEKTVALALVAKIEEAKMKHPMSAASAAMFSWSCTKSGNWWKRNKDLTQEKNEEIADAIIASYRGGICQLNKDYKNKEVLVNGFDINSLYPSIMRNTPMPFGQGRLVQSSNKRTSLHKVRISASIVPGYVPFLPKITNGLCEYPDRIEDFFCLWKDELDKVKVFYEGEIDEVGVIEFDEKRGLFSEFIDNWYKAKQTATNKVDRTFAKMMLNSLSGKFGQRKELLYSSLKLDGNRISYQPQFDKARQYDAKVSSFICSEGRCRLVEAIENNADRFIYCDTDSVILKGSGEPTDLLLDESKLGYFKHDKADVLFKALGQKTYMTTKDGVSSFTIAGVVRDVSKSLTKDDFKPGAIIKEARQDTVVVDGGIKLIPVIYTLPE